MALNTLIFNNIKESRFEFFVCGTWAVIEYAIGPEVIVFCHSSIRVSPGEGNWWDNLWQEDGSGGNEIPAEMIRYVLDYARNNHLKIVPTCPHIRRYIRLHSTDFFCIGKVFMGGG